jgi:hypothetical protein
MGKFVRGLVTGSMTDLRTLSKDSTSQRHSTF